MWADYVTLNVKAESTWSDSDFNVSRYYFIIFLLKSEAKKSDALLVQCLPFEPRLRPWIPSNIVFEVTGTLDDSASIYKFEQQIKPAIHSGIKNKHAAFTFVLFAVHINKVFILALTLLSQFSHIRRECFYRDIYFVSLPKDPLVYSYSSQL
jgi:hypothetical protein